jgi:hypothetical protein
MPSGFSNWHFGHFISCSSGCLELEPKRRGCTKNTKASREIRNPLEAG